MLKYIYSSPINTFTFITEISSICPQILLDISLMIIFTAGGELGRQQIWRLMVSNAFVKFGYTPILAILHCFTVQFSLCMIGKINVQFIILIQIFMIPCYLGCYESGSIFSFILQLSRSVFSEC